MKRILVTGGNGFLGSYVVEELLKDPNNDVSVLSHSGKKRRHRDLNFIDCDVRNEKCLTNKLKNFDIVYHIAGNTRTSKTDTCQLHHSINAIGTSNLLKACDKNGIKRFVFISTSEVYGDISKEGIKEDEKINPTSDYARSKAEAEGYCRDCTNTKKIKITIIRPSYIYGYGQNPERLFPKLVSSAAEYARQKNRYMNDRLSPNPGGNDFVYVKDAAKGIVLLGQQEQELYLETYNIASGKFATIKEVFDIVEEMTGYRYAYAEMSHGKVKKYSLNIEKAKKREYNPEYGLREGIADFLKCYNRHKEGLEVI